MLPSPRTPTRNCIRCNEREKNTIATAICTHVVVVVTVFVWLRSKCEATAAVTCLSFTTRRIMSSGEQPRKSREQNLGPSVGADRIDDDFFYGRWEQMIPFAAFIDWTLKRGTQVSDSARRHFSCSSDSEHDDDTFPTDLNGLSPSGQKRRVNFLTKKKSTVNGKPPTITPSSPSSNTKLRRGRLRTASRSGDERISFPGRNPIYTAGRHRTIEDGTSETDYRVTCV